MPTFVRFALTIAYDGRRYLGWQSQRGGNTVQDHLLAALQTVDTEIAKVHGSGRTDSGVCAEGQVAHFDVSEHSSLDAAAWVRALNTRLPATIRVMHARSVGEDFHARFSAIGKVYRYRLWLGRVLPPLEHGLAWRVRTPIDLDRLRSALAAFEGKRNFAAFAANRGDGKDANRDCHRMIHSVSVKVTGDAPLVEIHFDGNGFLYKMVRLLVGTAVRHAQTGDKPSLGAIQDLLESPEPNTKAPFCAPADGLSLISVNYSEAG